MCVRARRARRCCPTLPSYHLSQGKATLSAAELLSCFVLPSASEHEAEAAGFHAEGSCAHELFHELISDDLAFDEACRRRLFEWCTALRALPSAGLKDKIRLKLYQGVDESTLPETHTCTHELHLPDYSSREQLANRLLLALDHIHDGFHKD